MNLMQSTLPVSAPSLDTYKRKLTHNIILQSVQNPEQSCILQTIYPHFNFDNILRSVFLAALHMREESGRSPNDRHQR